MSVALAETAVIALDRRFDQARRVAGGSFKGVLTKADSDFARLYGRELRRDAAFGRSLRGVRCDMSLDRGPNQRAQLIVVHSTQSS